MLSQQQQHQKQGRSWVAEDSHEAAIHVCRAGQAECVEAGVQAPIDGNRKGAPHAEVSFITRLAGLHIADVLDGAGPWVLSGCHGAELELAPHLGLPFGPPVSGLSKAVAAECGCRGEPLGASQNATLHAGRCLALR